MDQKIRARNFEARSERIEKGAPAKGKGKPVRAERKQEECYQWKAIGKCTKRDACSFRHDENKPGESWKNHRKKSLSEVGVPLGRDLEERAKTTSVGESTNPRVITGIFPCVKITNQNRDTNSAQSAYSGTKRLTVSLTKDRKRMVGKVLLPC